MSQDISSDQDALAQKSDTSSVSTENQTQSSDLSNNNLTQEGQLQVIRKEIDEIKNVVYQEFHSIARVERRLEYSGPLPHPEILDGYEKVLSGSADRILKMAEKQLDHRISNENKLVDAENQSRLLGLIISRVNSPPLGAHEKSKKELQYPAACGGVVYSLVF
jgi:uncharacterized membrane protein